MSMAAVGSFDASSGGTTLFSFISTFSTIGNSLVSRFSSVQMF